MRLKTAQAWIFSLLALGFALPGLADPRDGNRFAPDHDAAAHVLVGIMDLDIPLNTLIRGIIQDAYVDIGRVPHFIASPPRRSLMLAGTGRLDAELYRVRAVEKQYPDLVRVDHPLYTVEAIAYAWNEGLPLFSCKDLKDYRVGVVRGIVLMESCAANARERVSVPDVPALNDLLVQQRVDVVLVERAQGQVIIDTRKPEGVKALPVPLLYEPIYHYVHRHHQSLAEPLAEALRRMDAAGGIQARTSLWRIGLMTAARTRSDVGPELGELGPENGGANDHAHPH